MSTPTRSNPKKKPNIWHTVLKLPLSQFGKGEQARHRRDVLIAVASFANPGGENCHPGHTGIMERSGCSKATVFRDLAWLRERGFLVIYSKGGYSSPKGRTNRYDIIIPSDIKAVKPEHSLPQIPCSDMGEHGLPQREHGLPQNKMVSHSANTVSHSTNTVSTTETQPTYRPTNRPTVTDLVTDLVARTEKNFSDKSSPGDRPQSTPEKEGSTATDTFPPGFQPGEVTEPTPEEAEAILTLPRDAWFRVYVMGEEEEEVRRVSQETGMPLEKLKEIRLRAWETRMRWIARGRKNLER
jgi:hypothetical protein